MSYFPQRAMGRTIASMRSFATYTARIDLGTSVRGSGVAAPTTQTTAAFTVPQLGGTVTVAVGSTTNFIPGDSVMIGTRAMVLTTPIHSTSGAGSLSLSGRYMQGRAAGTSLGPAGHSLIGPAGQQTTVTVGTLTLPNPINVTSVSVPIADRAQVPSNSYVKLTNYAGVYRVLSIPSGTSLQLEYYIPGDLPSGATCIRDTSGSDTGTAVTQFTPLGVVPKGHIFTYTDAWFTTLSVSGATATTPNISIGFNPNLWTSGPVTRMGEFVDNRGQYSGTTVPAGFAFNVVGEAGDTVNERVTPMDGMAFGIRVNTPASSSFIQDVCIRGLLSPMV